MNKTFIIKELNMLTSNVNQIFNDNTTRIACVSMFVHAIDYHLNFYLYGTTIHPTI